LLSWSHGLPLAGKSLKILYAIGSCGIDQNGIDGLDLVELYADSNKKITNISFMKT